MKYLVFVLAMVFSSVGCAASFHVPGDYVEYEYVYVPVRTKKVVTYYSPHSHKYKKKRVYRKRYLKKRRVIVRKNVHHYYH